MGKTKQGTNYDWNKLLASGTRTLLKGRDYDCLDWTIRTYAYKQAKKRTIKVVISQPREGALKLEVAESKRRKKSA